MATVTIDPWKATTIGLVLVAATALVTTFVVGQKSETEPPNQAQMKNRAVQHHRTTQAEIEQCNQYAAAQVGDKTTEVLKDAAIGAVAGAGAGAAGGAIAEGGKGAGKGAGIGGVVGAVGGTLYGLNETKGHDEQYRKAYASCMRTRGYE